MKRAIVMIVVAMAMLSGCVKKSEVPKITEWQPFSDQFVRATFSYPKVWHIVTDPPNKVTIYSSEAAMQKFFDKDPKSPDGSQIVFAAERNDSMKTLAQYVADFRSDRLAEQFEVKEATPVTLEGNPGFQVQYVGQYPEKTRLTSIRAITVKDSFVYYVDYSAFNDYFEPYKVVYDSALASLVLPKPRVVAKNVDISLPLAETETYKGDALDVTYPSNFQTYFPPPKGEVSFNLEVKGYRQDAFVTVDIRPAKKLTLEKVVNQNLKNFRNPGSHASTSIGDEKSIYYNYVPTKGVDGRVYFVVKNDKFYRIIMVYPTALKKDFFPVFEKTVLSMKIK